MAQVVGNFNALVSLLQTFKIEETDAIHMAEVFMDENKIDFDADGNFDDISVEYVAAEKKLKKA